MSYYLLNQFIVAWGIFFFVLILSTPHGRPLAKYMLLTFVIAQMITPLGIFLPQDITSPFSFNAYLYNLFYLSGPAFYFYIKALRSPAFSFKARCLWHFVTVLIIPLFFHGFLFQLEGNWGQGGFPAKSTNLLIMVVLFLTYLTASVRLLPGHWWSFQELLAPERDTIWRWLYIPILFYIGVYYLRLGTLIWEVVFPQSVTTLWIVGLLTISARMFFFFLIAVGGYRHRNIYEQQEELPSTEEEAIAETNQEKEKYLKSPFDEQRIQAIWGQLNDYLIQKKPYLNSDLKLAHLAQALGITANGLSQVINSCAKQNFYDFINSSRAYKAKELIEKHAGDNRPMLDISLEAGFGNSATFYKYFKKCHSATPAQYRKFCQSR